MWPPEVRICREEAAFRFTSPTMIAAERRERFHWPVSGALPLDLFTKLSITEHFSAFYVFILFREGLP